MKIVVSFGFTNGRQKMGIQDFGMEIVLGLSRLGHEVYVVDEINKVKECFDANWHQVSFEEWEGRLFFERWTKWLGVWPRSCLLSSTDQVTHGMPFNELVKVAKSADCLLNFEGRLKAHDIFEHIPCRAYIDCSPGKSQAYKTEYGIDPGLERHHHFFTFGLNIGKSNCDIPTCGFTWHGILVPVLLDLWPTNIHDHSNRFTTISSWTGRPTYNLKGKFSGEKVDQWWKLIDLPKYTNQELEIALDFESVPKEDKELLRKAGWILSDTTQFFTFEDYKRFIANSRAEFSSAHTPFVQFNVAWTGDRMTRYLASGKPVLVQETGIRDHLPLGKGLLTFTTIEEAINQIEEINSDYLVHCRAAREIAEEFFDSNKVLSKMLKIMT